MPRRSRTSNSKSQFNDVSIYNYANAPFATTKGKGRLSKAVATPAQTVEKLSKEGDLSWEERQEQLNEADALQDFDVKKREEKSSQFEDDSKRPYLILPIDVWFLIGDHIPPEDVQVFASICKSSQRVTNSSRFWFHLYRRYYKPSNLPILPEGLRPENMTCISGLRAKVIRSLFIIYPTFIQRLKPNMQKKCDNIQPLLRRKCISTWYTTNDKVWTYWFKLNQVNLKRCVASNPETRKNFTYNEEKDTKVLQVSSSQYIPLPAVHGLSLKKALITVSKDMMANKLTLSFESTDIVIDPASNIQVLDWWHPEYPYIVHQKSLKYSIGNSIFDVDSDDFVDSINDRWDDE